MKKRITLKDIARETGVHVSTVSRALDVNARTPLTEDIVTRIRETAERMGYRPNRLASGLRTNRTMTVGVLIPDITNALFPPFVRGIESVLEPLGYASILVNTDSLPEREARLIEVLRERGVDGILHAAALRDDPRIVEAKDQGVPVVTLNRMIENAGIPFVINDESAGVQAVLRHLFDQGHRRIAHLAGPQDLSTGLFRLNAFRAEMDALGLDRPDALIVAAERFSEDEGRRCAAALLDSRQPFTAMVCANDRLALGAIATLREAGRDCPADVSVTGFNDMPMLDLIPPRLTTVRIQQHAAGQKAAELLVGLMTGAGDEVPMKTVLPVELVVRDSTGPAPQ